MCNPNSTISAYRRHAKALQLRELHASGSQKTRNLLTNGAYQEQVIPSKMKDSNVPANNMQPHTEIECSMTEMIPTPFSSFHEAMDPPPSKPKRRRKPQKPGKTAKQHDRHFVVHNYHDHADDKDDKDSADRRGGSTASFPMKMHGILDQVETDGLSHIISWQPHGRCFVIRKPKEFANQVMPDYFRQTKLTSFQRQLNLYGFNRITRGNDSGGYYHELFLRGKTFLCKQMNRTKVKGTRFKAASSPDQEPNFYLMPPVQFTHLVTPQQSDCDTSDDGQYSAGTTSRPLLDSWQQVFQEPSCTPTSSIQDFSSAFSPVSPILAAPSKPDTSAVSYPIVSHQDSLDESELNELLGDNVPPNSSHQNSASLFGDLWLSTTWDPISYGRGDTTELANDAQLANLLGRLLD